MNINKTSPNQNNFNISDFQEISKVDIQNVRKQELQSNIEAKLNEKGFFSFIKKLFNPKRTVTLKTLSECLKNNTPPEFSWSSKYLPKTTQKLFNDYFSLFNEEFKETLSQEEFQGIWENKQSKPIGKGGFGTVYQSKEGKYALKVPNQGKSMSTDLQGNEALKDNAKAFDAAQLYYKENAGFITKYVGTFKTKEGTDVSVFEKIEGKDFNKCNAEKISLQCRFLAQAATAIAISHEAGCINSDIKPANMMVTKGSLLKLIDQGAIIDLTQGKTSATAYTSCYAAPEIHASKISPAADVFSLGVTILEKLSQLPNATENIEKLKNAIYLGFYQEAGGKLKNGPIKGLESFYREKVSNSIAQLCEQRNVLGSKEESKFVGLLLANCLAFKPEDRISAAQAGEILQVFSSYLEAKENDPKATCPDYNEIKSIAQKDCPKGIPIALREMLFNLNPEMQQKGSSIIKNLIEADPSYKKTPSYGFTLLLKEHGSNIFGRALAKVTSQETFSSWAAENKESLLWLKERTYIQGNIPQAHQDMPVSKDVYEKIKRI